MKSGGGYSRPCIGRLGAGQFGAINLAAARLNRRQRVNFRDAGEIEPSITQFSRLSNGGLILTGIALSIVHGKLIIALAVNTICPPSITTNLYEGWRPDCLRADW